MEKSSNYKGRQEEEEMNKAKNQNIQKTII